MPGCTARGRQRVKYMDGVIGTTEDGGKAIQILQVTRDRERDVAIHGHQRLQRHGTVIR